MIENRLEQMFSTTIRTEYIMNNNNLLRYTAYAVQNVDNIFEFE